MDLSNLFDVVDKSTNKSSKRKRSDSQSSKSSINSDSDSSINSPTHVQQEITYTLESEISYLGGFSNLVPTRGHLRKHAFLFPSTKLLSSKEREIHVRKFIAALYNVTDAGGEDTEQRIDKILSKLAPGPVKPYRECEKFHLNETGQAKNISQNVQMLPQNAVFLSPQPKIAPSTPGPRVSNVEDLNTSHTPADSLRIINHLQLSEDACRYIRKISLIGLSSEYSVKKLRHELLGNDGKGYVEAKKLIVKKWYRDYNQELKNFEKGGPKQQEVIVGCIPSDNIAIAVQHWAEQLTQRDEYVDLQQFENCPDILRDTVVVVIGNDSGQGYSREGLRFCNRENGNYGSKIFVTTMVEGSDKSLSLYQKQGLFSSLSGLRGKNCIKMGGKERKLLIFSAMDYEAAHEEFGTQVGQRSSSFFFGGEGGYFNSSVSKFERKSAIVSSLTQTPAILC